jgi:zinc/manganese transport system ATP-binding protein
LHVEAGEFLGAVGPSGSGKTTLIRALTGQCQILRGEIRLSGATPASRGRGVRRIGYVPQIGTVDTAFPISVERIVLQGLSSASPSPWPRRQDWDSVRQVLEQLHLDDLAQRPLASLSGGELQRTFLARALIRRPELLLLDEPTSSVDLKTRHDVLHLLGELHGHGMTILITTHDLNFVAAHLPRVVCLAATPDAAGSVVADGSPLDVFTPDVLRATYGAEVRVIHSQGMVFVADPTHILTPGQHHDRRDHPVEIPATGGTPPVREGG